MSVAQLTARELGLFAAIAHKHVGQPLPTMLQLAARISDGNCGAWMGTYEDHIEPVDSDEVEQWALDYLAGRREMIDDHFGPLVYNMVANNGKAYLSPFVEASGPQGAMILEAIKQVEEKCKAWQDREARAKRRAEEDAASFDDVGQQLKLSPAEVRERMTSAGANRVIVAEFSVNESDSQSDYYGGRTARQVVLGFATGKRENFRQLRRAAGMFPPTDDMGPGRDDYTPRVVLLDDVTSNGGAYYHGSHSHWHHELEDGANCRTKAEAEAWIAAKGEPHPISFDGQTVRFGWRINCESYENRENWSMGGGNYLGGNRYGGWKIRSYEGWGDGQRPVEFYQPTAADLERVAKMEADAKAATPPKQPKPKGPFWTAKGLLRERDDGLDWPQCFRKRATVEAKQAELRAAGVETEVRCGRRHNHFYLLRVDAATE